MFKNEIVYHEKWQTPDNKSALKELENKFFDRCICVSHCPLSWSNEVLEMLTIIDKKFGIKRNTQTVSGYTISKSTLFNLCVKQPLKDIVTIFRANTDYEDNYIPLEKRLNKIKKCLIYDIKYVIKVIKVRYINKYINKILKPTIELSQVKEKCGYLTVYFQSEDPECTQYINSLITEVAKKLLNKGAY